MFRNLGTLGQKAGVGIERLGALVVKELVDNALDAGAKVSVEEDGDWIVVSDDGPGIPGAQIPRLFSINRPLTSSKIVRLPQRGALGNGLRVVMGAVFASQGEIEVESNGVRYVLTPESDGTTSSVTSPSSYGKGTRVRLKLGPSIPTHDFPLMYYANYATIFSELGKHYKSDKTSVWWYDEASFFELLQAAGTMPLEELLGMFRDFNPKQAKIAGRDRLCNEIALSDTGALLRTLRLVSKKVSTATLGCIGEMYDPWFYGAKKGDWLLGTGVPAELPYVVEAFVSFNDKNDRDSVVVMVNRTPVTGEIGTWRTGSGKKSKFAMTGCGINHYVDAPKQAIRAIINITTPYMPITTDGKNPNLKAFLAPIMAAMKTAAGKAKRSRAQTDSGSRRSQREIIELYIRRAIAKASGDGKHRYSLRQLYYQIRPFLQGKFENELEYNYFASVITDYESTWGDLPGLYRDARGIIYHPHTGQEIPLGTLAIEAYERPKFTFNKILYCEKEGLFQILKDEKWPEKNDCALLSSKGYASRAARDVIDMIGDTTEEIHFFCIHDADASGTLIYQSLVEATRARGARRVHVHNLGLEPQEAIDMGLDIEYFTEGKKKRPVAKYVDWQWEEWFQTRRIELNAMSTPVLLQWLDEKMEGFVEKIVPPSYVLQDQLKIEARNHLRARLSARILEEANINQLVEDYAEKALDTYVDVVSVVKDGLEECLSDRWDAPIRQVAAEMAERVL